MRPIQLTLQYFGSYTEKQTIVFDKLGTQGLYLITGDTGSGKTKEKDDFLPQLIYLYHEFLNNYPRLKKYAMSPQVYLTHEGLSAQKGNMYLYDAYLQDVIKNHTITGSKGGHYSK